jgi:copper chaperone CopZ
MKHTETLSIEGMSCDHCVRAVQNAIAKTDGVDAEDVIIGAARVTYDPHNTDRDRLVEAIEEEGYKVVGVETEEAGG